MSSVIYFLAILLYTCALYMFGGYVRIIEILDIIECFLCKEMYPLDVSYDYVIVGCGTAGSIAALRLSEDPNTTVLVLEAGPNGNAIFDIPAIGPLLHLSSVDWQHSTVSQENAAKAYNEQKVNWPMGRIVGGSSRINNMVYSRGHPKDYEDWFQDLEGYNYHYDVLSYFKKNEDNRGIYKNNSNYHSTDGPLIVNDLSFSTIISDCFLKAVELLGFPVRDLNAEHSTGFMRPQINVESGARWSFAHLLDKKNRDNLVLQTNTFVTQVLFKSNYEAYAVKYFYLSEELTVRANKGVVLSAGVVGTPKILMLSGVGPKKHLYAKGIETVIDLPVGYNLQDHVSTGLDLVVLNTSLGFDPVSMMSPVSALNYLYNSTGMWTSVGCEVLGSINIKLNQTNDTFNERPNLGLMVLPVGVSTDGGYLYKSLGVTEEIWTNYFKHFVGRTVLTTLVINLHPKSRGVVRLSDKDPYSKPLIDPKYLQESDDVDILLDGIDLIKKIISTEPMQKLGAKINDKVFPGCEKFKFDTKPYWKCYVRHLTVTSYHYVGTCKMGSANDKSSVVNYGFQVHGTNKLYVVDASVMPSLPSGNPNAAVAMLGEKFVAEIRYHNFLNTKVCNKIERLIPNKVCLI